VPEPSYRSVINSEALSLAPRDFEYLRRLVRNHSSIVIDPAKEDLVESRLTPLARASGCGSLQDFLQLLQREPVGALHHKAVSALANHETWFFRDSSPFDVLIESVIPELMKNTARDRAIAIWSAACSTGQEPYSIAMLLRENMKTMQGNFSILATDFCHTALQRAYRARYRQMEVNRGLPTPLLTKYFVQYGLEWQLTPEISGMVSFRAMNLAESWAPMPQLDVIFLRNVLIYFATDTRRQVLARVHRVLRPDGFLFLGTAETPRDLDEGFEPAEVGHYLCYKPKQLGSQ
jgi:chemotaxis protein methyltransferase CheR